jgi:hypothetical protein
MIRKKAATVFLALAVVAAALAPAIEARAATIYDGNWSLAVFTRTGACDASYRLGGQIINGAIVYNGIGSVNVAGRVRSDGGVWLRVSSGGSYATASGRMTAVRGSGVWRGVSSGSRCSGTWVATRE